MGRLVKVSCCSPPEKRPDRADAAADGASVASDAQLAQAGEARAKNRLLAAFL